MKKGEIMSEEQKKNIRDCRAQRKASFGFLNSPDARLKMSLTRKGKKTWSKGLKLPQISGEKNGRWISDRTKLAKRQERNDSAYKEWRKKVRDRDAWKCQISNEACEGKVVAHHILPWSSFPELRYEVNNGITLCRTHHPKTRKDEMQFSPYFQSLVLKAN